MIGNILIGAIGGFVAARFLARRRFFGRGCGHHGGHGRFRGLGFGRGFPMRLRWLLRELDLDGPQRRVAREVGERVARAVAAVGIGMRAGRIGALDDLADLLGGDAFDRAAVESRLDAHVAAVSEVRRQLVDGLAQLHEVLRPEQRARLSQILRARGDAPPASASASPGGGHQDGPYR